MTNLDAFTHRLANTIANAAHPDLTTRWLVLVETIDTNGHRALTMTAQDGLKPWDTLGMLTHAIHLEQAATINAEDDQ